MDGHVESNFDTAADLGVIFDQSMTLDSHVKSLTPSYYSHLRNIAKLSTVASKSELESLNI